MFKEEIEAFHLINIVANVVGMILVMKPSFIFIDEANKDCNSIDDNNIVSSSKSL